MAFFGLVYYGLNRQFAKRQLVEEQLRLALDAARIGTWNWDMLTGKIEWSNRHAELFGLTLDRFDGTYETFNQCIHPEDRDCLTQGINRAIQEKRIYTHQYRVVWSNGSVRWIEGKGECFYDETGQAIRMAGTIMDISDRVAAQKALAASEKRLRTIIEAEPECVKVLSSDGRIQEMNAAGLSMIEADDLQQVIGQAACNLVVPKHRQAFVALTEQAFQGNPGTLEFEIIGLRGTRRWLETHAVPLHDEHNEITAVLGITRDITAQKQAEEDLRQSEEQLRLALEAARMGIWDWNVLTNQIIASSDCEQLFGLTPGTFGGTYEAFKACIYPEDLKPILQAVNKARLEQRDYHHQFRVVWSDGSIHWLEGKGRFFYDETGQAARMLGTVMDISDRKRAEAKLRQSEQKFRQLAENIHEVFWMTTADKRDILYVSPAYEQIWGRSCESLYANPKSYLNAIYPDDQPTAFVNAERSTSGTFDIEYRIIRPNGSMRWIRDRGFPILNESGEIYRRAGIAQDITQQKQAEAILRQVNEELEIRVQQRTAELKRANELLQRELLERRRVEQALRESEQRWQLAIQGSNDGIWDLNLKTNHCFHSARWAQMLGYEEHEVSNPEDKWQTRIHPDDVERVMQARQAHLDGKTPYYIAEYRLRCKDGSYKWILSRAQAVWDEAGTPVRMVGSHSDISDRKWAEEALRQSEERWQLALRGTNDGIWDWNVKTSEVFFSSRWKQMRGFEDHEVGNQLEAWSQGIHPDDRDRVMQAVADHFAKKIPFCVMEYRVRRKDNSYMWVCDRGQALWDEDGNVVRMAGSETDITERKQAEETLSKQACIFENLYDAVILTNMEGCIIDWNPAAERIFGYSKAEVLGKTPAIVHRAEQSSLLTEDILGNLQKAARWVGEVNFVRKDGTEGVCETVVVPLYNKQGEAIATIGVNKDITERKQAEETRRKQACIFENIYDGVILTDLDGRIIDWNPRAEMMFGYTKTEVLGRLPRISRNSEESALLTRQIIDEMANTGRWTGELNFICKEGTENICETCKGGTKSICETVVVPLHDEQGQVSAAIWVNRDISDRKQAEAALRRAYDELEIRVQERTVELAKANEELRVENAERKRVQAELKTRARQQAAVAQLGQQALASNQLDQLMDRAVSLVAQILEVEYCKVLELLPDGEALLLRAGTGWEDGWVGQATVKVGLDSQAGYTLISAEPVVVEDLHTEPRFNHSTLLHEHGIISGLSVIIPGENRPYGVLGAHTTRKRKFTKDDVHFLQATANVLATAINRQQAEEALRRAYDELEIRVQERTRDLAKANTELQQEIVERKQAEAERAKLIAILEATPDIVGHADLEQQICYLNSAGRKLLGFGEDEDLTNLTIPDAHPNWAYEILHNEGIPAAIQDGTWVGETAFLSHDGREIPVSQLLIAHKSPDGSVNLLSTVARDITQQKQIAATLQESERRWRSLLENVRLVVVGLDKNRKVEYINPCFLDLVGYTQAEVLGKDWFETFLPHQHRHQGQNNFLESLEQEFDSHEHSVILTKAGEERAIAWNNTLLQDVQGNVIGTLSIGEDITERQVIERMKDEFISVVSHELRTPLTSIHGALNLLSSGLVSTQTEKGRRVIEIAAESAERLVRLVNDILELERLESGKISLLKQRCNASELMRQAIDMMQVMANRAGITLSVSLQAIEFNADGDRIIQVLTNLLGNAIKFSHKGSTVQLSVELNNGSSIISNRKTEDLSPISHCQFPVIVFAIKDQGRGIPADKLESIFERFHQVDASDSRKKGGTGLGLAICRSIVQQHGGQIWAESTLGEGSSLYFTLPVILEDRKHDNQANLGD